MIRRPAGGATLVGLAVGLVGWLLAGLLGPLAVPSLAGAAAAAEPASQSLTVVANARYDVQPAHKRIHVTVDLQIANHRTDTVIRSYFYDHVVLGFLPGTMGFAVTPPSGSKVHPSVHVTSRTTARVLVSVVFGSKLRSGHSLGLKLTFDLLDKGGAADRAVRVGSAIATFPVWAVGTTDTPGSKVRVTTPADYRVEVLGSSMAGPTAGPSGTKMWSSVALSRPATFGAYILADRPGAYRETPLTLTVAGGPYAMTVRAWQDDPAFGTRTAALLRKAMPPLGALIGVPPIGAGNGDAPLSVEEAVTRSAGGYAALFDGAEGRIQVAYDAAPAVVLHEAAHAWFNGTLLADRWAAEGFASWYARTAAGPLKIAVPPLTLTPALLARRIPLNAWSSDGTPDPALDAFGMAASAELARLIAERTGRAGLTDVWQAIETGAMADQPVHATDTLDADPVGASAPDWRALLDLIETRTGKDLSDLWRTWVVRPEEAALLDRRATVRADYITLVTEAGDWEVPKAIRVAIDRWQFDQAADLIAQARTVLAGRPVLEAAATGVGVRLPPTLRTAFEGVASPAAAATELAAEQAAVARLAADFATRPVAPGPVIQVGLAGTDPDTDVEAARDAFATGDLIAAVRAADRAASVWTGALDTGRGRLALVAGILTIFAALVLLVTASRDRRSRARWSYRAGQVIRSMGPGGSRRVGPRSGAAWRGSEPLASAPGAGTRPAGRGTGSGHEPRRKAGVEPGPGTATRRVPAVQVTVRGTEHQSPAQSPMAHPIEDEPRGAYGTLAADLPADRTSAGPPSGHIASDGRPARAPRIGDDPPDRTPGEQ